MTVNNVFGKRSDNLITRSQFRGFGFSDSVKKSERTEDNTIKFDNTNNVDSTSDIAVIAHRGYSSVAPENTIPAFIAAAENGFNTVECDISWTKDSVPVILHDSSINRTARTEKGKKLFWPRKCSNLTYDQLLKYDFGVWKGEEFKGTKIPSFNELLDCSKEYGLNLYIELKKTSGFDEEKAKLLVDAVKEAGLEDKVTWISFEEDYLQTISDLMPDCRLGYLSDDKLTEDTIAILEDLKTDDNEVFLDIKASKMNEKADKLLDDAGFDFEAWTVDKSSSLDELYSYECKGITTNKLTDEDIDDFLNSLDE